MNTSHEYPCPELCQAERAILHQRITDLEQQVAALQAENERLRLALAHLPPSADSHFRRFFEQSQDGLILMNAQGMILEWNRGAERILGVERATAIGQLRWEVIARLMPAELRTPEQLDRIHRSTLTFIERARQATSQNGTAERFERTIQRPDGTRCTVSSYAFPIHTGAELLFGNIIRDITARVQAEEAYRTLVDNSLQGLAVHQQGRCVFTNEAAARITGYSVAEMLAMSPDEAAATIHPDDRALVIQRARERQAGEAVPQHYTFRILHKNGSVRWLEAFAIRVQYQGRPAAHMAYIDITERKQAEASLRTLSRAIEQSSASVVITSANGTIEYVNPYFTQVTGYTLAEAVGQNPRILKSGYVTPSVYATLWQRISSGKEWRGEFYNRKKNGDYYWEFATITPVFDEDGKITHYVAVKEDITERKQAEEALRASERFVQQIANTMPDILYIYDLVLDRNVYSNRHVYEALGYTAAEIQAIGSDFLPSHLHPDDLPRAMHQRVMLAQATDEVILTFEYRIRHRDGRWRWLLSREVVFARNAAGQPQQILGVARDITEEKQAEEALRASEAKFRSIIEQSSDGIALLDEQGLFVEWNAGMERMTGLARAALIGQPAWDILYRLVPGDRQTPALLERYSASVRSATATGTAPWFNQLQEQELQNPDGTRWYAQQLSFPIKVSGGFLICSIIRDISARKRMEETLRTNQARLQAIFDNAAVGIFQMTPDGHWLDINRRGCEMLGYSLEELSQVTYSDILHPADRANYWHQIQLIRWQAQKSYRTERRYLRKDGSVFWGDLSVTAIVNAAGEVETILGILVNITARKAAEAALQQINQQLQQQAIRDGLTGLYNRRYLDATLAREIQRATRHQQPLAVIMLDIDHFKRVNDTYGHDAGDALLREMGTFLQARTRGEDIACRYGGEEFMLVLPGAALEDTRQRAELLRAELQMLIVQHQGQALERVTVSLGVAVFPNHGMSTDALIRAADQALYQAKRTGRDRVVVAGERTPL